MSKTRAEATEWRRRRLMAAGFEAALASGLVRDEAIDLHELLVLLDRGCPPELGPDPRAARRRVARMVSRHATDTLPRLATEPATPPDALDAESHRWLDAR